MTLRFNTKAIFLTAALAVTLAVTASAQLGTILRAAVSR
jgi:hypothetical protein